MSAARDWANTAARDLEAEIDKIATLDPSEEWTHDVAGRIYKTASSSTHKTKKEPRVITKFAPTEHHPGQADVVYEDGVVGYWDSVKTSTALPMADKRQLLARVEALSNAVKSAREEANDIEAPSREVSKAIFDCVFSRT